METIIQSRANFVIASSAATTQSILSFCGAMNCFASLAMTGVCGTGSGLEHHR
jgi:hypothetical protein